MSAVVTHGVVALRIRGIKQTAIARQYTISQGEVSKILKRMLRMYLPLGLVLDVLS